MFSSIVKTKELHDNAKKTQMTFNLSTSSFLSPKRSISNGILQIDHHLLILDGHVSHFTSKTIEQAQAFVLDMGILPSHTSRALQTLNGFSFKPFETTFSKNQRCSNKIPCN